MEADVAKLWQDIRNGSFDINNQDLFFGILSKAFLYNINKKLSIRGIPIPHYILNTGDDILYLEVKGQDHSIERPAISGVTPVVSNENFVYSQIPRCLVQPSGINIQTDQLTSPYSYGCFEVEKDDMIYVFRSEFRRIPVTMTYSLKYYLDTFSDGLSVVQQIITKMAFINTFDFSYLGNVLKASYQMPDSEQVEYQMEFDGLSQENKCRTVSFDVEVCTNIPIVYPETAIPADCIIKNMVSGVLVQGAQDITIRTGMKVYQKGGIEEAVQGGNLPYDISNNEIKIIGK